MENDPMSQRRRFARHKAEIAIEVRLGTLVPSSKEYLNNISLGGLSFKSKIALLKDTVIQVRLPLTHPIYETKAKVVWCRPNGTIFDIGVEFQNQNLKENIVEQICDIAEYKKQVLEKDGRKLTSEEAALEWLAKIAKENQK